jgi:ABC-type transporter Mla subunit MlaD
VNTILVNLLLAALKNERVQQAVGDFISGIVTQKLLPLLPLAAAAAAKAVADQIPQLANVANVAQVADEVRDRLNEVIPDVDFGIPALDELLDFWRPKG